MKVLLCYFVLLASASSALGPLAVYDTSGGSFVIPREMAEGLGKISRSLIPEDVLGVVAAFGHVSSRMAAVGTLGNGVGQFSQPHSVTVLPHGNLVVADIGNHQLVFLDSVGNFIPAVDSLGSALGQLIRPNALTVLSNGNLVVADSGNHRLVFLDSDGNVIRTVGSFGSALGQFNEPQGVAIGPDRKTIVIADTGNHRIVFYYPEEGTGTAGTASDTH